MRRGERKPGTVTVSNAGRFSVAVAVDESASEPAALCAAFVSGALVRFAYAPILCNGVAMIAWEAEL